MGHTTRSRAVGRSLAKVALATLTSFAMISPSLVSASTVDVDSVVDVSAPPSSVILSPGQSSSITINIVVRQPQSGTATFKVNRDWSLSNGTFTGSNPQTFTSTAQSGNATQSFTATGTVSVAAGQSSGTFVVTVGAFDLTNTASNGQVLRDGTDATYTVTVPDTTPPVITPTITGTLGTNGWYTSNVNLTWFVTDAESTVTNPTGCGASSVTTDTTGVTFTCSATSVGGPASRSVTIKRDATAPTITSSITPAAAASGWYNSSTGAPTATFACTDATSTIATCTAPFTFGEGTNLTATGTAVDQAGNTATSQAGPVKVDLTGPTMTAALDRAAADSGWFNAATGAPSVVFSCSADVTCPPAHPFADGADQAVSETVTDAAGNTVTAGVTDVDVDTVAPSISASIAPAPAANGWYNDSTGAPVASFTCDDDGGSGVATCSAPFTFGDGIGQTHTGMATDVAGNQAGATTAAVDVDLTKPTISASFDRLPDAATGWYNLTTGAPTVSFTCSDDVTCPGSITFGTGADQAYSETVTDEAGNSATASGDDIDVDLIRPTITASIAPNRPSTGWWNIASGAPTVSFSCSDATSGLAGSCPSGVTVTTDGADQSVTRSVFDLAGNEASATRSDIDVDLTAPTVSASLDRTPGATGWFNETTGAPVVEFTCSDATSDIDTCPANHALGEGANQSFDGSAVDGAGNTAVAGVTDVDVDLTDPTITASLSPANPSSTGWYNRETGAPVAHFVCDDDLSGSATCEDDVEFGEGTGLTHLGTATDVAGNTANASAGPVDVDLTVPTITATLDRAPAGSGWFNKLVGAPTVTYGCSDALSGLAGVTGCAASHLFGEGADQQHTGTATDAAGNTATAGVTDVDVDTVAPVLTATMPVEPASGWYTTKPSVSFSCIEATSGLAGGCPTAHEFGEGADQQFQTTITDVAGNESNVAGATGVDVDLTAPGVTWTGGPAAGSSHYFGFVPAAPTCSATDALSGPHGCVVTGYGTSVGQHTMTASATDVAGNTGTATRSYTVLGWTTKGFSQPVDMNGVLNTVKGGSTVPLKFEVFAGATELTSTTAIAGFTVRQISCSTTAPIDDIELTTTGGTSLRYDSTGGQFIQNWQTPRSAGSCYTVSVTMQDGSVITASFKLK